MTGPIEAVRIGLRRTFQFSGTASRSEYWWFMLFILLVLITTGELIKFFFYRSVDPLDVHAMSSGLRITGVFIALCVFSIIPILSTGVRRLHDIGFSGWWQLLSFTVIGGPVLLVLFVLPTRSETGEVS